MSQKKYNRSIAKKEAVKLFDEMKAYYGLSDKWHIRFMPELFTGGFCNRKNKSIDICMAKRHFGVDPIDDKKLIVHEATHIFGGSLHSHAFYAVYRYMLKKWLGIKRLTREERLDMRISIAHAIYVRTGKKYFQIKEKGIAGTLEVVEEIDPETKAVKIDWKSTEGLTFVEGFTIDPKELEELKGGSIERPK